MTLARLTFCALLFIVAIDALLVPNTLQVKILAVIVVAAALYILWQGVEKECRE